MRICTFSGSEAHSLAQLEMVSAAEQASMKGIGWF